MFRESIKDDANFFKLRPRVVERLKKYALNAFVDDDGGEIGLECKEGALDDRHQDIRFMDQLGSDDVGALRPLATRVKVASASVPISPPFKLLVEGDVVFALANENHIFITKVENFDSLAL